MSDSPFESSDATEARALRLWQADEQAALRGKQLASAEADSVARDSYQKDNKYKRPRMIWELACEHPEKFMELVTKLPHALQDIFFQRYLLGRTEAQIAELFEVSTFPIQTALKTGIDGLCAIVAGETEGESELAQAYRRMLEFRVECGELRLERSPELGQMVIEIDEETLEMQFQPVTADGATT